MNEKSLKNETTGEENKPLKYGWTTGACATAATKAAFEALLIGSFDKTVTITLPKGQTPTFEVIKGDLTETSASAGIIKDAGDDPDVTHGATIIAHVRQMDKAHQEQKEHKEATAITFKAGKGVGVVTKPGLPLAPGEPAINPVPRQMMQEVIEELAKKHGVSANVEIEISVPGGEKLAEQTWNPRLGIKGGISILGTTGIVVPYSCSAWIHSIHRGIDVARAEGTQHIGAAVGKTSDALLQRERGLKETEIIDMGDFVGGMLKYLKKHPVPKLTIAGGFAKMSKLACGAMDLHSKRTTVDKAALAQLLAGLNAPEAMVESAANANTALEILTMAEKTNLPLGDEVAKACLQVAEEKLASDKIKLEILITDRKGTLIGTAKAPGFDDGQAKA